MKAFVFLFFLLVVSASTVSACDCWSGATPCQDYWKASAVFKGTVIHTSPITYKRGEHDFSGRAVRFTIDQSFRGVTGNEVEVMTGLGGGDCGYPFRLGGQYIVYALRDREKLTASICGRTRFVSEASDDLAYFAGLATAQPGATIFGEVKRRDKAETLEETLRPVSDVKIVIEGTSKRIEAITDKKGNYRVSGVAPGTYKVRVELSEGLDIHNSEREAKVFDRGCAEVSFWVETDTRVTGKVFDAQGQPAADVLMELVPTEANAYPTSVRTDNEGRYELKRVRPGRYLFGVRIFGQAGSTYVPFPRTYYPGVSEVSRATIISVAEGQRIELNDLILPGRFVEKILNGIVVDADGRPVSGATVWLKEREYQDRDMPYRKETDAEGRFSFKVYEGINYELKAYLDIANGIRKQAERSIRISSDSEILKLVLR